MNRWSTRLALTLLCCRAVLSATTVIPPSFDDLVSKADTIFLGRAAASRSAFEYSRTGRSIVTHVTFLVERVLKGRLGLQTELTFLGGTVGDLRLEVADMPEFRVGERAVLFVSGDPLAASPLVGFSYGRFRVVRDPMSGVDQVRTHDGRSLASVTEIGRPPAFTLRAVQAMTFADFESMVRRRADAPRAR